MKNFKEIAEKCLVGELSGTFVLRNGKVFHSQTHLSTTGLYALPYCIAGWCYSVVGNCYSSSVSVTDNDVIDFIPDNMQKQVKIDIPEGKMPIMEQTENGVVITWKEKELTYEEIFDHLYKNKEVIHYPANHGPSNELNTLFIKKINVLRKLINIRNYFGKPKHNTYGHALYYTIEQGIHTTPALYPSNDQRVIFDTKEHAEQAIKMLGDELKCLFKPW